MDTQQNPTSTRAQRVHSTRFWIRLLALITVLMVFGAAIYDLFPNFVLAHRVNQFMEVAEMGAHREKIDAELARRGFEVPEWRGQQGNAIELYLIRSREPILERVADAIAFALHRDTWWASKKRPHHAYITYDADNKVVAIQLDSQVNPLWY